MYVIFCYNRFIDAVAEGSGACSQSKRRGFDSCPHLISTMKIHNYLAQLLTESSKYQLTEDDESFISQYGLEHFIYAKLTSKKFRKFKMEDETVIRTKNAISLQVENNSPLKVLFPQGGYKLWRLSSSPWVDWAEFFTIAYVLTYIAPIVQAYKPGIHITFYMHTLLMEVHDNLSKEEIQAYVESFEKLLGEFRKYIPANVTISILRDVDIYEREQYFSALNKAKFQVVDEFQQLSERQKENFARMAKLNIKWNGKENWNELSKVDKDEKVYDASLYEFAVSKLPRVIEKVKSPNNILIFTTGTKDFIGIGSTKSTIAKYWVGYGVLEKRIDTYFPVILTPSQYEESFQFEHKTISVDLISLPNFSHIIVFEKSFAYSKSKK